MNSILKQVSQVETLLNSSSCKLLASSTIEIFKSHLSQIKQTCQKCTCDAKISTSFSKGDSSLSDVDNKESNDVDVIMSIISKPFAESKFENDYNGIQTKLWKDFRGNDSNTSKKIPTQAFLSKNKHEVNELINLWQNYVTLRLRILELNLKKEIPFLYKNYLQLDRVNIGLLNKDSKQNSKMLHVLLKQNEITNYSNTLQYYIIFRAVCALMTNYISKTANFDTFKEHLIKEIIKTKMFSDTIKDESSLIDILFNSNTNVFHWFLEECVMKSKWNYIAIQMILLLFNYCVLKKDSNNNNNNNTKDLKSFFRFIRALGIYCIFYESNKNELINKPKYLTKYRKYITKNVVLCQYLKQDTILHLICRIGGNQMVFNVITQKAFPANKKTKMCDVRVEYFFHYKNGKGETCASIIKTFENKKKINKNQSQIIEYMRNKNNEYKQWLNKQKHKNNNIKKIEALPGKIESNCNQFIKQQMLSKYFLLFLGCNITNDNTIYNEQNRNYIDLSQLTQLGLVNNKDAISMMNIFVNTIIKLIANKIGLSDDWLVLAYIYCDHFDLKLKEKLILTLQESGSQCLDSNYKSMTKVRDYQWFKQYLMSSNIWLMNNNNVSNTEEEKDEINSVRNTGLLYDSIAHIVNNALLDTQKIIFDGIKYEKKNFDLEWNELVNFDGSKLKAIRIPLATLRQNDKSIGIVPNYSEEELIIMSENISQTYNILEEYNIKHYLTQCLSIAHAINNQFQNDLQFIFDKINHECQLTNKILFQRAPVKLEQRCIIKTLAKYNEETFPSVARICDFVRASVTFENCKDLLISLKKFIQIIVGRNGKCITRIVRIKNGFSMANQWDENNISDCKYFDLKLNVVIMYQKLKMICEIQFLLKSLLKAKKIGHKLYGMSRKEDYFTAVAEMAQKDQNWMKYLEKITKYANDNKFDQLSQEMVIKPNILLSMSMQDKYSKLLQIKSPKYFELHISSMLHFEKYLLQNNDKKNDLKETYLQFCDKLAGQASNKHKYIVEKAKQST